MGQPAWTVASCGPSVLCGELAGAERVCPAHPRCICTSSSGAWPTSTPKACVTVTSSPRICLWTLTQLSSSSVILAGRLTWRLWDA